MILEISTHGSSLKRDHDCFIIQNRDEKTEIPAEKIDAINITANILVSTQAIKLCIEKNIQLVVSDYYGRPFSRMWASTPGKSTELRRNQYLNQDSIFALKFSQKIVDLKLKRQRKYLIYLGNNRKNKPTEILDAISSFNQSIAKIANILDQSIDDPKSSILGIEGFCASQYFRAISSILPKKWSFKQRSQHPAQDPFNAMLNYFYGMGYSSVEKIIILSGLDPNAGFFHSDSYAKPTLSFDFMELIRPRLDRSVVSLFTKRKVRDSWFERTNSDNYNSEIFLSKEGRKVLISEYVLNNQKNVENEIWIRCKQLSEQLQSTNMIK